VPVPHMRASTVGPGLLADPYPLLAELPAAFHAPGLDMWVLTRFADIEAVVPRPGDVLPLDRAGPRCSR